MKPWPTLLTFQLWNLLEVSLSQNGCSQPPVVLHAHVPEQSRKDEYRLGETIVFTCDAGFTSELPIKYVCSGEGWVTLRQVSCYSPTANCERPPAHGGLRINGLPENNSPIPPGHVLIFSCDDPEKRLNGSSVLICDRDGQWNKPVPSCEGIPCDVPQLGPGLRTSPIITRVKSGGILNLFCSSEYELDGANELKCLDSGLWSSTFPTCTRTCEMPNIPQFLLQLTHVEGTRAKKGQKLNFECRQRGKFIQGNAEIECLESGDWSDQLPKCGDVRVCSSPPPIEFGDIMTAKAEYREGETVEYDCPNYYVMEGGPRRTCRNGQWTGHIRCIKPCTVTKEDMNKNNLEFRRDWLDKIYSEHNDHITFKCVQGKRHDGRVNMRQQCIEGVIQLPTCV